MVTLEGPLAAPFIIVFLVLWAYSMLCGLMMIRNSNDKVGRWFGTVWFSHTLNEAGRRWRRRSLLTLAAALILFLLALLIFPRAA